MRFYIPLDTRPSLKVTDVGKPHLRIQLSDFWAYVLELGLVEDGDYLYTFLKQHSISHWYSSIRFNPSTWFGKFVLQLSLDHFLPFAMYAMYHNLWIRHPYFLHRRIRPHLLQPNFHTIKHKVSLHNLLRNRLKLSTSSSITPQPTLPQTHKTSFQPISSSPTTPSLFRPPYHQVHGLSLPRRHPREGVG